MELALDGKAGLKLDLACGRCPKEYVDAAGEKRQFDGVDLYEPSARHNVNLMQFPWPFEDDSVEEIHCSHFIEHLPMVFVDKGGKILKQAPGGPGDLDMLFRFMEECWRILRNGAKATFICPNARSNRGFQDPTHRRFIVAETFYYFHRPWLEANGLTHYAGKANFNVDVNPSNFQRELSALHPEAQYRRCNESWNVIGDWVAVLTALKDALSVPKQE